MYLYSSHVVVHESPSAHFCNQVRPIVPSIFRSQVESSPKEPIYKRGVSWKLRPTLQLRALPKLLTTFNTFVSYMSFSLEVRRPSSAHKGRGSDVLTVIARTFNPPPKQHKSSPGIIFLSYSLSAFE